MLIAVDGSEHADRAIECVARMARSGVPFEVVLLNVSATPDAAGESSPERRDATESACKRAQDHLLADAESRVLGCGLTLNATLRATGSPPHEIVRIADEHAVDQIVIGTHGCGATGGLLLGAVARGVVHLSKRPVLLVP